MKKNVKWAAVLVFAAVICTGVAALISSPPASAKGGQCWQVDCNTCCRLGGGPVICTQRACV
jgi:hypothetical protein